jgi:hypothetical protein
MQDFLEIKNIIIDDLRFVNEVKQLQDIENFVLIGLKLSPYVQSLRGTILNPNHQSEIEVSDLLKLPITNVINSDQPLEDMLSDVSFLVENWL